MKMKKEKTKINNGPVFSLLLSFHRSQGSSFLLGLSSENLFSFFCFQKTSDIALPTFDSISRLLGLFFCCNLVTLSLPTELACTESTNQNKTKSKVSLSQKWSVSVRVCQFCQFNKLSKVDIQIRLFKT